MRLFLLLVLNLGLVSAIACHPESSWQCDDPVCYQTCQPNCTRPVCDVICESSNPNPCYNTFQVVHACHTVCPPDQCEADSCPACSVICPILPFCKPGEVCQTECQIIECNWINCETNFDCKPPTCVLQHNMPTCAGDLSKAGTLLTGFTVIILAALL